MTEDVRCEPKVDVPLLRKAVEWVRFQAALPEEEREWYQDAWRDHGQQMGRACGTTYCVAGYVAEISGAQWVSDTWLAAEDGDRSGAASLITGDDGVQVTPVVTVSYRAERLLGLTANEADHMFYGANTLDDIERMAQRVAKRAGEKL